MPDEKIVSIKQARKKVEKASEADALFTFLNREMFGRTLAVLEEFESILNSKKVTEALGDGSKDFVLGSLFLLHATFWFRRMEGKNLDYPHKLNITHSELQILIPLLLSRLMSLDDGSFLEALKSSALYRRLMKDR